MYIYMDEIYRSKTRIYNKHHNEIDYDFMTKKVLRLVL